MDPVDVTVREGKIRLKGFRHAVKAITLDESEAELLGDLALHHIDLRFAAECLAALDTAPETTDPVREALWRSALVAYFKCFTNSRARRKLDVGRSIRTRTRWPSRTSTTSRPYATSTSCTMKTRGARSALSRFSTEQPLTGRSPGWQPQPSRPSRLMRNPLARYAS
jgi:hypothetical protein